MTFPAPNVSSIKFKVGFGEEVIRLIGDRNIESSQHQNVQQSGSHESMTEKKSIQSI